MPDLEQQPAPTRRLGRITSVTAGHGGAANMYTVDNGRSHFYGSDEVLAVLSTRLDLHPISLPPSTRLNNSAPELRVLRATTTFPGPRQCLVTLEFEYQRKFDNQVRLTRSHRNDGHLHSVWLGKIRLSLVNCALLLPQVDSGERAGQCDVGPVRSKPSLLRQLQPDGCDAAFRRYLL